MNMVLQEVHYVTTVCEFRFIEWGFPELILDASRCSVREKEFDRLNVTLTDRFVQRSVAELSRRIHFCTCIYQSGHLFCITANRCNSERTFTEVADLVHIVKCNFGECRKVFVFIAT